MGVESAIKSPPTERKLKQNEIKTEEIQRQRLVIISLNGAFNNSSFNNPSKEGPLPAPKTETLDTLKRKDRIDLYRKMQNYAGFPPKQVTDSISHLNTTNEVRKASVKPDYVKPDSYSKGAENAFSLALNRADTTARSQIKELVMLDAFSNGDTQGIDFLVIMQDGSKWGFDAKTPGAMRSDKVANQITIHKGCKVTPIYKEGVLDPTATTQMLVDLIEEARGSIT